MSRLVDFDMTLRGVEVNIEGRLMPPDHDAGIPGYDIEDLTVVGVEDGMELKNLSETEIEEIIEVAVRRSEGVPEDDEEEEDADDWDETDDEDEEDSW